MSKKSAKQLPAKTSRVSHVFAKWEKLAQFYGKNGKPEHHTSCDYEISTLCLHDTEMWGDTALGCKAKESWNEETYPAGDKIKVWQ